MTKRSANSPAASAPTPKRRNRVTLAVKLDIIKRSEGGQGPSEIGRALGLSASTVGTIIKNAPRLKEVGDSVTPTTATKLSRSRDNVMENMERLLSAWIEDCNRRHVPLSLKVIQEKALSLWKDVHKKRKPCKDAPQAAESFSASRGWFNRFKKRANLHNICVNGKAAGADTESANGYLAKLQDMPSKTYIAQDEKTAPGFKAYKDRLTLPLGRNVEDDDQGQTRFKDQSSSEQRVNCVQHTEGLRKESCTSVKSCEWKHKQLGTEPPLGNLEPEEEITDLIEIKVEEEELSCPLDDEVCNTPTQDALEVVSSTCLPSTDQLKVDCNDSNTMPVRKTMEMDVDHQLDSHLQTSEGAEDPPQYTRTAKMVGQLLATLSPSAQLKMTVEVMQFIVERLPHYKET